MCDNIGRLHFFMVSTGRGGQLLRGNVVTVHFTQVSIEESPSSVNEVKLIPDQEIPFVQFLGRNTRCKQQSEFC